MNQKKIGDFLRKLRHEKELTQIQLAEILFVSNKSVSRWEKGKSLPDIDILMKLAHFYDVSLEELLDGQRNEMANNTESTALKVAEFENEEKKKMGSRNCVFFCACAGGGIRSGLCGLQTADAGTDSGKDGR